MYVSLCVCMCVGVCVGVHAFIYACKHMCKMSVQLSVCTVAMLRQAYNGCHDDPPMTSYYTGRPDDQ